MSKFSICVKRPLSNRTLHFAIHYTLQRLRQILNAYAKTWHLILIASLLLFSLTNYNIVIFKLVKNQNFSLQIPKYKIYRKK